MPERVPLIREALGSQGWVLSGSLNGWGDPLIASVDLIAFIVTPTPVRMERLRQRERERFGARILPGGDMHGIHTGFAAWAERYDDPTFSGRNIARHEAWLGEQRVPILRLDGIQPHEALVAAVMAKSAQFGDRR